MISSARGFGAPDSVPAGKVARKTSIEVASGRRSPSTLETRCMMWLNRSTCMNSVTSTDPATQTFDRSLRARSTSMRCSACSFGSRQQLVGQLDVALRRLAARFDPAIGCVNTRPACTFTSASGDEPTIEYDSPGTFDDAGLSRVSRYMYGLGIERAQHAVDVDRLGRDLVVEPLRDHHLEHVAVADVLLRPLDARAVVRRCTAGTGSARSRGRPRRARPRTARASRCCRASSAPGRVPEGVGVSARR
jgi:hypothetical protein